MGEYLVKVPPSPSHYRDIGHGVEVGGAAKRRRSRGRAWNGGGRRPFE